LLLRKCRNPLAKNGIFTPFSPRISDTRATQTMKKDDKRIRPDTETELKLALPGNEPAELLRRLSNAAVLKRRKPVQQQLYSIYFDTPEQLLAQHEVALRVRRIEQVGAPHWVQTLKTGKRGHSALSRRGEWESPVAGPALEYAALPTTAWARLDPDGKVQATLGPCFETDFNRTIWLVRRRDGSAVEVALDIGHVASGDNKTAICELELELKAGPATALFDIALQIAATVLVLPLAMSKAQRGFALATGAVDAPVPANPPRLRADASLRDTARTVLREMFGQFTANLAAMRGSDDPEIVHQTRVAWRRFKSARRLFKPVLATMATPDWKALDPLLAFLGELRDLDVAHTETLPPLRDAYVAQDAVHASTWDTMLLSLAQARDMQRTSVRCALEQPSVGLCLLQTTLWLELPPPEPDTAGNEPALRRWADRRTRRLHERLKLASNHASDAQSLHNVRLLAKRTRYSIDALRGMLPRHTVRKWYRQAVSLQKKIGADRDLDQAIALLTGNDTPADLVAFLRGVVAGRRN